MLGIGTATKIIKQKLVNGLDSLSMHLAGETVFQDPITKKTLSLKKLEDTINKFIEKSSNVSLPEDFVDRYIDILNTVAADPKDLELSKDKFRFLIQDLIAEQPENEKQKSLTNFSRFLQNLNLSLTPQVFSSRFNDVLKDLLSEVLFDTTVRPVISEVSKEQWLNDSRFSRPAPQSINPVSVNSPLPPPSSSINQAIQNRRSGNIVLDIEDLNDLRQLINCSKREGLLENEQITVNLKLDLSFSVEQELKHLSVKSNNFIIRTDSQQSQRLDEILKNREESVNAENLLAAANPHLRFVRAASPLQAHSGTSSSPQPISLPTIHFKPYFPVKVIPVENDFDSKHVRDLLEIKKTGLTFRKDELEQKIKSEYKVHADGISVNYKSLQNSFLEGVLAGQGMSEHDAEVVTDRFLKLHVFNLSDINQNIFSELSETQLRAFTENYEKMLGHLKSVQPDIFTRDISEVYNKYFSDALRNKCPNDQAYEFLQENFSVEAFIKTHSTLKQVAEFQQSLTKLRDSELVSALNPDEKEVFLSLYFEKLKSGRNDLEDYPVNVLLERTRKDFDLYGLNYLVNNKNQIKQILNKVLPGQEPFINFFTDLQINQLKSASNDNVLLPSFKLFLEINNLSDSSSISFNQFLEQVVESTKINDDKLFPPINSEDSNIDGNKPLTFLQSLLDNNSAEDYLGQLLSSALLNSLKTIDPNNRSLANDMQKVLLEALFNEDVSISSSIDSLSSLLNKNNSNKTEVLKVKVDEDFDESDYLRVIANDGNLAIVLASVPNKDNAFIHEAVNQLESCLDAYEDKLDIPRDLLEAKLANSMLVRYLDSLDADDLTSRADFSKFILKHEVNRNLPGINCDYFISSRHDQLLDKDLIKKEILLARLDGMNSLNLRVSINTVLEFLTDDNSTNSPYKRFNGLILSATELGDIKDFYENLKQISSPSEIKRELFSVFYPKFNDSLDNNFNSISINSNKYKEFRTDILLMQRKGSSEEEITEFVKLNLASVFESLPENSEQNLTAIEKLINDIDSKLTDDMKIHSLSTLNLKPAIAAALDTPVNKLEKQMKAALLNNPNLNLENSFTRDEINFYIETQKLSTQMKLDGADEAEIKQATAIKLMAFMNTTAEAEGLKDFNLIALRKNEAEFTAKLLNTLSNLKNTADAYLERNKSRIFENSLLDTFKPLTLAIPPRTDSVQVQALIDDLVINLLKSPEEEALRNKVFGTNASARKDELQLPSGDIRNAFIEVSRELINASRNPDLSMDLALIQGAFTENISKDTAKTNTPSPEALFMGQYAAFTDLSKQCNDLIKQNNDLGFLTKTFYPVTGAANRLCFIHDAIKFNTKEQNTELFIKESFLVHLDSLKEPSLNDEFLSTKINLAKPKLLNYLTVLAAILDPKRESSSPLSFSSKLSEYLDTNINFIKENFREIPYLDTTSTMAKLNSAKAVSTAFSDGDKGVLNKIFKDAIEKSDAFKTISQSGSPDSFSSNLSEIITDLVLEAKTEAKLSDEDLNLAIYKLYKDSNYDSKFLNNIEAILANLNKSAELGDEFKFTARLEDKVKELKVTWTDKSNTLNKTKLLDFSLDYLIKENKDDEALVKAYRSLRTAFKTQSGSGINPNEQADNNLKLIQDFKDAFKQKNNSINSDENYLNELSRLDAIYSPILEAHSIPPNQNFSSSVENFIKETNEILENTKTKAQPLLVQQLEKANPSLSEEQLQKSADAYLKTYLEMQRLYRTDKELLENYIDKSVTGALKTADPINSATRVLKLFTEISRILDGIFTGLLKDSPKANFTPLSETFNEIRQKQNDRLLNK